MSNKILEFFQSNLDKAPAEMAPPFNKWLNGIMREAEPGNILMEFTVRREMTNPIGILHGGMHAAMIDEVIGMAVVTLNDRTFYTTLNLSIDYLDKASLGETILARGMVVRNGKNILNAVCEIRNTEGKLLSKGSSNLFNTQIPLSFEKV